MARLLPSSTESPRERRLVGAGTLLLHVLLAWWLVQTAGRGLAGAGELSTGGGNGNALVVEFVALPSPASRARISPVPLMREQRDTTARPDTTSLDTNSNITHVLSETGEYTPPDAPSKPLASSSSHPIGASTAKGGNPGDDPLASYHAALRAAIRSKWSDLTDRPFPSGCTLGMTLATGGALNATSANGCVLSGEDRLQLEAAALMAQPLPYAGYEAVFVPELALTL